ncbi:sulfurtransferase [Nocardioides lentus]|uniref:Sulfurtransferase n=1 Tax=Nocardioides lentus TaxID=338077 RepID=A0ABP5ADH2_9ACTN
MTLLDVRWRLGATDGFDRYAAGHLPGASYVDMDAVLADHAVVDGGRHPLPDVDLFGAAVRALGVRRDTPVVCYDAAGGTSAARAWWLLRHHGHERVAVLDGGYPAWVAAGHEVETGPGPEVEPGDFEPVPGAMPTASPADLLDGRVVLDARPQERYRGEVEPVDPVAGHVPGARSAPAVANLGEDGLLRPDEELRARYAGLGALEEGADVAVYCGSGITAAHDVLVLEQLGVRAALYPGSWSHWVSDPSRPVETGPGPGDAR